MLGRRVIFHQQNVSRQDLYDPSFAQCPLPSSFQKYFRAFHAIKQPLGPSAILKLIYLLAAHPENKQLLAGRVHSKPLVTVKLIQS